MTRLQFHPVWEDKLTQKQKEELFTFFEGLAPIHKEFGVALVRGKYKKNGGAVATVLLRNGFEKPMDIERVKAKILDRDNILIAEEEFELDLRLQAESALPWSFVFSNDSVIKPSIDPNNWMIHVHLPLKKE
ncbi:hypothetical protein J22TS1_04650 [Siminovitchia terrae]|uniref:SLAP domain-containing protein n=1 Tax=Siminovitchia terrae TaxID=1914933 RepID=UPI001B103CCE|nr:SLAP domain-containing protein [Siminovitchia terrae]GIN89414.1 hypothetical protein J22TS1_04650 [Siminovitchia terrae]